MEHQISNQDIKVLISSVGAELQSVRKDGVEYLWNGDSRFWPERSPILFPYVGRFTEGKYLLNGKIYEMDIHGFARKLPFEVADQKKDRITFRLRDNKETYQAYPYHFILDIIYALQEHTIEITYRVNNLSNEPMYFGIGGHPGFALPFDEGLDFTDYYLEFDGNARPERIGFTKSCFLSGTDQEFLLDNGKNLRLSHDLFDEDAIVLRHMADKVTLKSDKGKRKVTVSYPELPYLGLWHAPGVEAPYLCIEPWASLPSRQDIIEEFRYKSDLIRLSPGREYVNKWGITIE